LPGEHEIALETANAEVRVESVQQERRVDIGGEHLLLRAAQYFLARERGTARKNGVDRRPPFERTHARGDPVADGRQQAGDARVVANPSGQLCPQLSVFGPQHVLASVLRSDPSGDQIVFVELLELGRPRFVPAELLQGCVEQRESPLVSVGTPRRPPVGRPSSRGSGKLSADPRAAWLYGRRRSELSFVRASFRRERVAP